MLIHEYRDEHSRDAVNAAYQMCLGTIMNLHNETKEHCTLDPQEIDVLKDAVQTLVYLKQIK